MSDDAPDPRAESKSVRWAAREQFFDEAAERSPLLMATTKHGRYLVSTADRVVGRGLFAKEFRPEMSSLRHVARLLAADPQLPSPKGSTFVDVGANIGTTSVTALRAGFGRAVALEPSPQNVELLRLNALLNGVADEIEIFAAAVSDQPGEVQLQLSSTNWGDHRVVAASSPDGDAVTVQAVTLDQLVMDGTIRPEEVGLLWIDVQGYEGHVVAGAARLLEHRPATVLELWPEGLSAAGGLESLLDVVGQTYPRFVDLRERSSDDKAAYSARPTSELRALCDALGSDHTDLLLLPSD